jgi:hypothetical protein
MCLFWIEFEKERANEFMVKKRHENDGLLPKRNTDTSKKKNKL